MFNDMVLNSYLLFTDEDIDNFLKVNFIDKETYDKVIELRKSTAENGGAKGAE